MLFTGLGCCGGYYRDYYKSYCRDCYKGSCRGYRWVRISFTDLACYTSCPGTVGVREDVLALKLNRVKNL